MNKKIELQRVDNHQLGSLYATRAMQTGIPAEEAERFANLIRTCQRPLYDAYRRRGNLIGIREGPTDLTADANQAGKALLEQILAGLLRLPAALSQFQSKSEGSTHPPEYIEQGGYAGIEAFVDTASTGARWNGHKYISDWRRFT